MWACLNSSHFTKTDSVFLNYNFFFSDYKKITLSLMHFFKINLLVFSWKSQRWPGLWCLSPPFNRSKYHYQLLQQGICCPTIIIHSCRSTAATDAVGHSVIKDIYILRWLCKSPQKKQQQKKNSINHKILLVSFLISSCWNDGGVKNKLLPGPQTEIWEQ